MFKIVTSSRDYNGSLNGWSSLEGFAVFISNLDDHIETVYEEIAELQGDDVTKPPGN